MAAGSNPVVPVTDVWFLRFRGYRPTIGTLLIISGVSSPPPDNAQTATKRKNSSQGPQLPTRCRGQDSHQMTSPKAMQLNPVRLQERRALAVRDARFQSRNASQ